MLIGIGTVQAARRDASTVLTGGAATPVGVRRAFREGVLVEALNPKSAAFLLAFVPQFVDLAEGSVALRFMILGFVSVALDTGSDVVVAFAMIALGVGLVTARRPTS